MKKTRKHNHVWVYGVYCISVRKSFLIIRWCECGLSEESELKNVKFGKRTNYIVEK